MKNSFKQKLRDSKEISVGSWLTLAHRGIAEIMCNAGFEWVCIDIEHTMIGTHEVGDLITTIDNKGKVPLVRLTENNPSTIKRIMDCGAHGIIVPMINSKNDVIKAYQAMHYPPLGIRGVGLSRAQGYGASFEQYKKDLLSSAILIVQIEHIDAVNNLEEILECKEVDGFIIGPYDLSASLGIPGQFDNPKFLQAMAKIAEVSKKFAIAGGLHIVEPDLERLQKIINDGYRFIAYSVDMRMLDVACRQATSKLKELK